MDIPEVRCVYDEFFEPFTYVYKDGKCIYEKVGIPNTVNATHVAYFKVGPYKCYPEEEMVETRTMYIDTMMWMY